MERKVLHILNELNFSGAEVMLNLAASEFQEKGIRLYALSTGKEIGNYSEILRRAGYTIHHIPFSKSLAFFNKVKNYLQEEKFDVVHLHAERGFLLYTFATKLAGIKSVVRTVHNVFRYTGYLRVKKVTERFIARRVLNLKFLSIGASVNEVEKEHLFNKTVIVPNWIDQKKFKPAENELEKKFLRTKLGIAENDFVVVSVGSCSVVKNHKDIIKAVAEVTRQAPIKYLHVGAGELHEAEQAYADELGIGAHVKFLGQRENVRDILIASDVFVMSSLYEGLGNSLLEALSCGMPAVVYNTYGLKDLVEDGVNGFLVDSKPEELTKAIIRLMSNYSLREKMGTNAQEKVNAEYCMPVTLEKLIGLY